MFKIYTFFIEKNSMDWSKYYEPTIFKTFDEALEYIESYKLDECEYTYLSNYITLKGIHIYSKKNKDYNIMGFHTKTSVVLIIEE